jgi:putative acetyltransferase
MQAADRDLLITTVDPLGEDALKLLEAFRNEMLHRYLDLIGPSGPPPPEDGLGARGICLVVKWDRRSVACGAFREFDPTTAELKRVYVVPEFRRTGIARRLVAELERRAVEGGFQFVRLETGKRQPEAVALYEAAGYTQIALYGRHVGDPMSVCFEKGPAQLRAGKIRA